MAVDVSWLTDIMPLLSFALVFVLAYAIITKTKITGESNSINFLISLILAIIFISFSSIREYLENITPWFITLLVIGFFFSMMIAFLIKSDEWSKFTKPLLLIFIVLFALILIVTLFYIFPEAKAALPNSWTNSECSALTSQAQYDYFREDKCYKYEGKWRCYDSGKYYWHDYCKKQDGYYKCRTQNENNSCNENSFFSLIGSYTNRKDVQNAIYLIIAAAIVGFIITRK